MTRWLNREIAIAIKTALEIDLDRDDDARSTLGLLPPPGTAGVAPDLALEVAHLYLAIEEPATARQRDRVVELAGPARRLIRQRKHALQNRAKAN